MYRSLYYTRRQAVRPSEFEEGYWGVVTDPDGMRRDLATERDKKVEDLAAELAFVNKLAPGRLLDVGCGLGHLLSGVDPRWERHGVEISQYAAERARAHGTIVHGDLRSAAYPDRWFDVVTLYHVIEHMKDPERELREIKRVLRPGGWLVVGTPNFDSACARRFGEKFRLLHDATHISLFGAESLRRLLEDNGLSVEWEDYPFFETRYFTRENLDRLFDTTQMSPPFYGNIMTFYARAPERAPAVDSFAVAGRTAWRIAACAGREMDRAIAIVESVARSGGTLFVAGADSERRAAMLRGHGLRAEPLDAATVGARGLEGASPADALLAIACDATSRTWIAEAHRRGISVTAVVTRGGAADADVIIEVPPSDSVATLIACDALVATLGIACAVNRHAPARLPASGSSRPAACAFG